MSEQPTNGPIVGSTYVHEQHIRRGVTFVALVTVKEIKGPRVWWTSRTGGLGASKLADWGRWFRLATPEDLFRPWYEVAA